MLRVKFKGLLNESLKLGYKVDQMADRLPEDMYVLKYSSGGGVNFELHKDLGEDELGEENSARLGKLRMYFDKDKNAYEVNLAEVEGGYGPLLYELALEFASGKSNGLMPFAFGTSEDAQAVWDIYRVRDDVQVDMDSNIYSKDNDNITRKLTEKGQLRNEEAEHDSWVSKFTSEN